MEFAFLAGLVLHHSGGSRARTSIMLDSDVHMLGGCVNGGGEGGGGEVGGGGDGGSGGGGKHVEVVSSQAAAQLKGVPMHSG